jgi:hypothetical protein
MKITGAPKAFKFESESSSSRRRINRSVKNDRQQGLGRILPRQDPCPLKTAAMKSLRLNRGSETKVFPNLKKNPLANHFKKK